MYKLIALSALLAVCAAAPAPSGLVTYAAPVGIVAPAVTSYSSHSSSVVHGVPVVAVPVVHSALHTPVFHTVPVAYSTGGVVPILV